MGIRAWSASLVGFVLFAATGRTEDPAVPPGPTLKYFQNSHMSGPVSADDGRVTLVHSGTEAWIVKAEDGRVVVIPLRHKTRGYPQEIKTCAFSKNGRLVATGTGDIKSDGKDTNGSVCVWDVGTGALVARGEQTGEVFHLAFSEDDRELRIDCRELSGK